LHFTELPISYQLVLTVCRVSFICYHYCHLFIGVGRTHKKWKFQILFTKCKFSVNSHSQRNS